MRYKYISFLLAKAHDTYYLRYLPSLCTYLCTYLCTCLAKYVSPAVFGTSSPRKGPAWICGKLGKEGGDVKKVGEEGISRVQTTGMRACSLQSILFFRVTSDLPIFLSYLFPQNTPYIDSQYFLSNSDSIYISITYPILNHPQSNSRSIFSSWFTSK